MTHSLLVVDDDPDIGRLYARALDPLGAVVTARGGAEALVCLAERRFDAIVLDLFMPNVSGFDILGRLAQPSSPNHTTPVFVVTADPSEGTRFRAHKGGAVYQLTKPVPLRVLFEQVKAQLERGPRVSIAPASHDPKRR